MDAASDGFHLGPLRANEGGNQTNNEPKARSTEAELTPQATVFTSALFPVSQPLPPASLMLGHLGPYVGLSWLYVGICGEPAFLISWGALAPTDHPSRMRSSNACFRNLLKTISKKTKKNWAQAGNWTPQATVFTSAPYGLTREGTKPTTSQKPGVRKLN